MSTVWVIYVEHEDGGYIIDIYNDKNKAEERRRAFVFEQWKDGKDISKWDILIAQYEIK